MRGLISAALIALVSCGRAPAPAPAAHGGLGGDAVARVGDVVIPGALVGAVARAQNTDVHTALDHLIDDALAAQAARARGDDRDPAVSWETVTILGRSTAENARSVAAAAGLPSDAEVAQLSRTHWLDVDVPESMRVAHAVVLRPKDASQIDAARALAARLASTLAHATDEEDFEARAKTTPHGALEVRVENVPRFTEDGRFVSSEHSYLDSAFSRGAFALKKVGDVSGVVESSFGWHVIRLLERFPAKSTPIEERRSMFAEEVITQRARTALDALVNRRRASTHIEILPDAESRMAELVPVGTP